MRYCRKYLISLLFMLGYCLPAWGQENPYTYVKMSLTVPWALYFMFLAFVLIPFILFIILAWREHLTKKNNPQQQKPQ